jgi:Family of unknown function (DUF6444)
MKNWSNSELRIPSCVKHCEGKTKNYSSHAHPIRTYVKGSNKRSRRLSRSKSTPKISKDRWPGGHERVKTLEGQQAKDSHNSHLPPSSDRFVRPPKSLRQKSGKKPSGQKGHRGLTPAWKSPMRSSFIRLSSVNTASTICVLSQQNCQSAAR